MTKTMTIMMCDDVINVTIYRVNRITVARTYKPSLTQQVLEPVNQVVLVCQIGL